jgi:transcriptional regulator with XRE-family HTH domain
MIMGIRGKEIVERIDQRRSVLGVTRKDVALSAGLKSVQSITDWSNGSIPQADTALYIADKLGVSVRWLLTGEEDRGYTPDERNLVSKYRRLTEQGQYEINVLLDAKLTALYVDEDEKKEA